MPLNHYPKDLHTYIQDFIDMFMSVLGVILVGWSIGG